MSAHFSPRSGHHLPRPVCRKVRLLFYMTAFQERGREVQGAADASPICRQLSLLSALDTNFPALAPLFATLKLLYNFCFSANVWAPATEQEVPGAANGSTLSR